MSVGHFLNIIDVLVAFWATILAIVAKFWGNALETATKDTVATGKYTSKETATHTDALEVCLPQPALALEQNCNARPVWQTWPRFNQQGRPSDRSKVPYALGWETDLLVDLKTIKEHTDGQPPVVVESDGAVQILSPIIESLIDDQLPISFPSATEKEEDDIAPLTAPRVEAGLVPKCLRKHEVRTQRGGSRSQASRSIRRRPSMSNSDADANAKVQRVGRDGVTKLRFQCRRKSDIAGVPTSHREGTEEEAQRPQRSTGEEAIIDSNAEADGCMVGLEAEDLMVGLEILMVRLKISEQIAESIEVGEPMDITSGDNTGDVDAVMLGSDVDGEMEVDGETAEDVDEVMVGSDVDGEMDVDGDTPHSDDEPMQLE